MVRHTLVVKPDVSNRELLARAKEIAPEAVDGLSLRQFHGKFRLPIVRFEMTPRKAKKNGAAPKTESATPRTESQASPTAEKAAAPAPSRKRSRKKAKTAAAVDIGGAVREVLIDFAVELEKAERRSELVSVVAGVDGFVKRIVDAADEAYSRQSRSAA